MRRGGDGPGPGSTDATRPTLPVPGPAVPAAEPLTRTRSRASPVLLSRTGTASWTLSSVLPGPAPSPAAPGPGVRGFSPPPGGGVCPEPSRPGPHVSDPGCGPGPSPAGAVRDCPGRVRRRPSCPLLSPYVLSRPLPGIMHPSGGLPPGTPGRTAGRSRPMSTAATTLMPPRFGSAADVSALTRSSSAAGSSSLWTRSTAPRPGPTTTAPEPRRPPPWLPSTTREPDQRRTAGSSP